VADADDLALVRRATVQAGDLPGEGWVTTRSEAPLRRGGRPDPDDPLDACLTGFPDDRVVVSADSDRFTRGDALAYSVVWVLGDVAAAGDAFAALAAEPFASCFADAVAADVDPEGGRAELLGAAHDPVGPVDLGLDDARGALHRARLVAGGGGGTLAIHLDVLALQHGRLVTVVFLADSPDPMAAADLAAVASRVAHRLAR
jgi:hypothetical protein